MPRDERTILLAEENVCAPEQYVPQRTKKAPELPRTPCMRTSQNAQNANFALLKFSEVALRSPKHPQGMLRVVPKGIMEAPGRPYSERGSASCLTCWCAIRLRTTSDGSLCSTTTTGQPESGAAPREDGSCAAPTTLTSW